MELTLKIKGQESLKETTELVRWLREERIREVSSVSQVEEPPKLGEQGPTLLAVIGIVLGAKATIELVKSIHHWIDARKRKITIIIVTKDKKILIDCENPPDIIDLISSISEIAE